MQQAIPRSTTRPSVKNLMIFVVSLICIVLVVSYILKSFSAGRAIPASEPLLVEKSITLEVPVNQYFGCIDINAPIISHPGRGALYADSHYVACDNMPVLDFATIAEDDGSYTLISNSDGDKFSCAAMPKEFSDLLTCKRVS